MSTTTRPVAPFEVLSVVDTRDYEEKGDRMVPVPGTGDASECARCDSVHEVHARIRDALGDVYVVGTGCATAETTAARRYARQATTAARKAAEDARRAECLAALRSAAAKAVALEFPAHLIARTVIEIPGRQPRHYWGVQGAKVYGTAHHDDAERVACLERVWLKDRAVEALGGIDAARRAERHAKFPLTNAIGAALVVVA